MDTIDSQDEFSEFSQNIHWGHFGVVVVTMVLILGMSWMEKPDLFSVKNSTSASDESVPRYYAYVAPAEDQPQPAVLGASTNQGPSIINDDGTVSSVDLGQVLGATTEGVQLSLDSIKVNQVPDSDQAVRDYFSAAFNVEKDSVNNDDFAAALNSGNQTLINQQAQKIISARDALQKLSVPAGLVKLQKLQIIQYNSAVSMLQSFTKAGDNSVQVSNDLQQFLKSQQDLDTENAAVAQKYGSLDPYAGAYINTDVSSAQADGSVDFLEVGNSTQNNLGSLSDNNAKQ